jgi:hypothetical protein
MAMSNIRISYIIIFLLLLPYKSLFGQCDCEISQIIKETDLLSYNELKRFSARWEGDFMKKYTYTFLAKPHQKYILRAYEKDGSGNNSM